MSLIFACDVGPIDGSGGGKLASGCDPGNDGFDGLVFIKSAVGRVAWTWRWKRPLVIGNT